MPERVLFVTRGIPSERDPLLGIFELDQAVALMEKGVEVTIFSVDLRSLRRKRKLGVSKGTEKGVRWFSIAVPVGAVPVKLLCRVGKLALRYLFRHVHSEVGRPDIIHAHFAEMGCIASSLAEREHIPLVITEHSSHLNNDYVNPGLLDCAIVGYKKASVLLSVSNALAANIWKKTGIDSIVVPNLIDVGLFSKCVHHEHEGFRIVTTSNLVQGKRTLTLLQAFAKMAGSARDIHLDVVGDGPMRPSLESFVQNHELEQLVTFHGRLSREEIAALYETEDCFALVSERETFGVAYVEALAAGLPVIATKCGGPEDFVDDTNGILVDVDNVDQITSALNSIRTKTVFFNESKLKGTASRFSGDAIAGELIAIYSSIDGQK